ncbi:MAG: hydroxyethylthiazole kinase [Succiniclasticum sp.]|jgi:hydroxyethylthiazole kinase|nr:hydroxyethylthiazole kinase [Succiniclasticum sp.]
MEAKPIPLTSLAHPVLADVLARLFAEIRERSRREAPLVHCLTHGITQNDSANGILAVGGRPNMASHPDEVSEAVRGAAALTVNLGNITAERLVAIDRAGAAACRKGIPILLDAVGVGFSTLRRDFAHRFVKQYRPAVVKGNASELRALCGLSCHGTGVDVAAADAVSTLAAARREAAALRPFADQWHTVLLETGAVDIVIPTEGLSPERQPSVSGSAFVGNGTPTLARLTGTGCLLGALAGVWLAVANPWEAALLAASTLGVAGERAEEAVWQQRAKPVPLGSFHTALLDALSTLDTAALAAALRVTV